MIIFKGRVLGLCPHLGSASVGLIRTGPETLPFSQASRTQVFRVAHPLDYKTLTVEGTEPGLQAFIPKLTVRSERHT